MNLGSMVLYLGIIFLTTLLTFIYEKNLEKRWKWVILFFIIFIPSFFAAIRLNIGTDFSIHKSVFIDVLEGGIVEKRAEIGYVLLNQIVIFLHGNYHIVLFLVSFISTICVFSTFYTYRDKVSISFGMFAYMLLYYQMSYNFVRQLLAASIGIFACVLFLKQNKKILPILLCIIASCFHITGLIYVPVILLYPLLTKEEYHKKRNLLFLFLATLVFIYPFILMPLLETIQELIPPLRYFINYLAVDYKSIGVGILRYPLLFIGFGFVFYSQMEDKFKWIFHVLILGFILWLTSYVTKMEFYRISHMYLMFIPLLYGYYWKNIDNLSTLIPYIDKNKWIYSHRNILIKGLFVIMLMFFWYYDFFYLGAHETVPYQSIFGII